MTGEMKVSNTLPAVGLLIPYFGPFPSWFNVWLKSCKYNPRIDWNVITDNDVRDLPTPRNVHFHAKTFTSVRDEIEARLGYRTALTTPYKLCDFKPAYRLLFPDILEPYYYWGFCDLDTIWGDIESMVAPLMRRNFDKIFAGGHLTFLRDTPEVNSLFRKSEEFDGVPFEKIARTPEVYGFDEWGQRGDGYNELVRRAGMSIYLDSMPYADIKVRHHSLRNNREGFGSQTAQAEERAKRHVVYRWREGRLFQFYLDGAGREGFQEEAYIHLQKRPIVAQIDLSDPPNDFVIAPPGHLLEAPESLDAEYLSRVAKRRRFYPQAWKLRARGFRRRLQKYLARRRPGGTHTRPESR